MHPGYLFKISLQESKRLMRLTLRFKKLASRLIPPLDLKTLPNEPAAPADHFVRTSAHRPLRLSVAAALVFTLIAGVASAQRYTSIVVFGDSLSDTGNDAALTQAKYGFRFPGNEPSFPADYTDGRFTDGMDTIPAAQNYFGVWIEQLAATLPAKPPIKASLEGGENYAYGFAFTGNGTTDFIFDPTHGLFITVNNVGQQVSDYLATHPKIDDKTLFVVWAGANDVINATSSKVIIDAAVDQAINVQRLAEAGATQFIVPNLPNLGAIPRFNGSPVTSVPATKATVLYNTVLKAGVDIVSLANPGAKIVQFDVYGLITKVLASPAKYGLVDVTDSSQGNYVINPDTYLFWDDLHPTTKGHNILAQAAGSLLAPCTNWVQCDLIAAGAGQ
jgi:outer membrane lipase/esterase